MKKLINDPEQYTEEMLEGIVAANNDLIKQVEDSNILMRSDAPAEGRPNIVTGGGTGHEPASSCLVGPGMLDGVAMGELFTAPSATLIADLFSACDGGEGVLAIVGNYSGDIMNFEAAEDIVTATTDVQVEQVVVADDVATKDTEQGARGVCGMVLVCKVAAAAAKRGDDIQKIKQVAQRAADNVATMGVGLSPCVVPGNDEPMIDLGPDEIEYGIGNHGEAGVERSSMGSAKEITERLAGKVVTELGLESDDRVVTMVNGMGATPVGELYVVNNNLHSMLRNENIRIEQTWVGNYTTSLDMEGCSIVIMRLDDELRDLMSAPAQTPGFSVGGKI